VPQAPALSDIPGGPLAAAHVQPRGVDALAKDPRQQRGEIVIFHP
jgi:hypothetical protein